jgi:hypothetical protein
MERVQVRLFQLEANMLTSGKPKTRLIKYDLAE